MDFRDISYLAKGSPVQQLAFNEIMALELWEKLKRFDPVLCGTIPIGIDIGGSDLDIICSYPDFIEAQTYLSQQFAPKPQFSLQRKEIRGLPSLICQFQAKHFPIEIFIQQQPSTSQNAYRHMIIEHHILKKEGEEFRKQIIQLKQQGVKTEPAFAQLLGLVGDPYESLLEYGEKQLGIGGRN